MKKWYASCSLLLLAAMTTQLVGCASTSRTVGRWIGRGEPKTDIAQIDGQAEKADKSVESAKTAKAGSKKKTDSSEVAAKDKSKATKKDELVADSSEKSAAATKAKPKSKADAPAEKTEKIAATGKAATEEKKEAPIVAQIVKTAPAEKSSESKSAFEESEGTIQSSRKSADVDPSTEVAKGTPFADSSPFSLQDELPPIGSAKLSSGVQKPPSADSSVAQGTHKITPQAIPETDKSSEVAQATSSNDLPEWALEDPATTASSSAPLISQTAATKLQPGQPVEAVSQLIPEESSPANATGTLTPALATKVLPSSLCPTAQGEVRELCKGLDSSNPEDLKRTIHRLGRMQKHAIAAQPGLEALLTHKDSFVRVHAALALVRMDVVHAGVTQSLIDGLRSSDPGVRSFSAAVLVELGPSAADALPALSRALHDKDEYVRLHVAEVLIRHEDWSYQALQALTGSLSSRDENIRWLATYSLAELAPQSEEAVSALTTALSDPVARVQIGAAYALGEIGPMAQRSAPALEKCLTSDNSELKSAAEFALTQIQTPSAQ